ncbi:hypothetical protein [Pseudoalteromonas luteoviolacea]|uniref:Uncharacterized protein n=1 Tax=Pseudoalteromonas luteoviolacea S4060-1 TaxID=1365257 RepID=A0A167MR62_9GAMM|nr:hypothetical protein [Pseudoalteromonas luteoviolacea]KZN34934.1 hypothetical protein N480_20315 [Pseudoalteromonas luteoviolacea S2607]KZN66827.1 hypothetical protein N478_18500 [Pseudoalteromonas luteoviolacea S4060-1]
MSLEQDIANVVSAAEQLTGIVDTKIEDINSTVNSKVSEMNSTISQQVTRVDNALESKQVLGDGTRGTKSVAIAGFFTTEGGATNMHLKLPFKIDTHNCMFHLNIYGYEYGSNKIVDATFTGYCYASNNRLYQSRTSGSHEPIVYVGTDQHIYLRITLESQYYLTLSVDSTYVGNGRVLKPGDVHFISSTEAQL